MGVAGNSTSSRRRRKSRTSSGMSASAVDARLSGASRQFSDGGGGERTVKSASAMAQEALTAGGALQTVEGREEGAVAMKVSVGEHCVGRRK